MTLRVAHRIACSEAEGPHRRYAVWVQGCTLACPGCCNPELFPAAGGLEVPVATIVEELAAARRIHAIEGLTVLGGEPLEQAAFVGALFAACQEAGIHTTLDTSGKWETGAAQAVLPPPDEALLPAVLVKLFTDRQILVAPEVIDWLALRMDRDLDLARRLVAAMDRESLADRRAITRRLAAELLDKLAPPDA